MILSLAYDNTVLTSLNPFTVGNAQNGSTVQQKTIDGSGTVQSFPMRSGQTVVLTGISTNSERATKRRLDDFAPMVVGGSDAASRTKSTTVILVTAVAEDGI
jgi:hypothetical protein